MPDAIKQFKVRIQDLINKYPNTALHDEQTLLERFQRMGEFTELEVQNIDRITNDALKQDPELTLKAVKIILNKVVKKHFNLG